MVEIFELNIMTNDGWVVSLLSDKQIDLGDTVIGSIIAQPIKEHSERISVGDEPGVTRTAYKLGRL